MTTVFETLFADHAQEPLKENFGESMTYTAPDGSSTVATATLGVERVSEQSGRDGRSRRREAQARFFLSDLSGISIAGKVTRTNAEGTDEVWAIEEIPYRSGTQTGVTLVRIETVEVSRSEFRRPG